MDAWIDYRDCKKACVDNGLADFILQSEDVIYPYHMLDKVFLKAFYYAWIEEKISSIPSVSGFNSRVHTDNVCKFRELDTHQLPVAQMRIREKLLNGMPDRTKLLLLVIVSSYHLLTFFRQVLATILIMM